MEAREVWKDIEGYEGLYQISNFGRLKSLRRLVKNSKKDFGVLKERILSNPKNKYGYVTSWLRKDNKDKIFLRHRLVGQHFLDNPNNYKIINHKNNNKTDNRVCNLEWVNHRENRTHFIDKKTTSSNYTGVSFVKNAKHKPWYSCICIKGKSKGLGHYETEFEAHEAYMKALSENDLKNKYATKNI